MTNQPAGPCGLYVPLHMGKAYLPILALWFAATGCVEAPSMGDGDGITQVAPPNVPGDTNSIQQAASLPSHLTVTNDPNNPQVSLGVTLSPLLQPARCIDVPSGSSANGVPVQLWDCNGYAPAQSWEWNGGTLRIQGGQKCLVAGNADILQATSVVLTDCSTVSAAPQQGVWNYLNGLLQAGTANRCLSLGDSLGQRGIALTLAACSSTDARQRWGVDNHDATYLRGGVITVGSNSAKCLDVTGGSSADGSTVVIFDCNAGAAQQWVMEGLEIRALNKCLTASGSDGILLEIDTCNGANTQQWVLNNGQIQRVSNGDCVELTANNTANNTRPETTACSGALQQQWVWGGYN